MRHNAAGRKLGRTTAHRLAMFRNQLTSLMTSERIITTLPKAKELRPIAEKLVTQGKRGTVHARRLVGRWIASRDVIKRVFDEIAPRFESRPGGYLRIVKLGPRQGDGAEMAVLEFVDFEVKKGASGSTEPEAKKASKRSRRASGGGEAAGGEAEKKPAEKKRAAGKSSKAATAAGDAKAAKPSKPAATKKRTTTPKKIGGS
ncbi:MAG: 50S ribosomal protein L17 [Acidobacteria bacterium]|nr:50S ribosomal protein L17 [Acidobacteriota bacterium]